MKKEDIKTKVIEIKEEMDEVFNNVDKYCKDRNLEYRDFYPYFMGVIQCKIDMLAKDLENEY